MKTLTQVVLPIAAIAGLVFGITYMSNYTARNRNTEDDKNKKGGSVQALKFPILTARTDPSDWRLKDWNSDFEVGAKGSYDFWFSNTIDQQVRIGVVGTSCTCARVDIGIFPVAEWEQYVRDAHSPLLSTINAARLVPKIEWRNISEHGNKGDIQFPAAASANQPQVGIVRLHWEAKGQEGGPDAPVRISADLVSQLPNNSAAPLRLEALYTVVQPLQIYLPGSRPGSISLGDLVSGSTISREIIYWSKTRNDLPLTFELTPAGTYKDCVVISEPKRLSPDEIVSLTSNLRGGDQPVFTVRSAYRVFLTVYEHREIEQNGKKELHQLDLGPISFNIQASAGTKPVPLPVRGMVRGEIRIIAGGETTDAIDFGTSFSSNETKTKRVTIVSERAGLDVEHLNDKRLPDYLEVQMTPLGEKEGRKSWDLKVTIPAQNLFGDLPPNAQVILQTKDTPPRKIRIPVRAKTLN